MYNLTAESSVITRLMVQNSRKACGDNWHRNISQANFIFLKKGKYYYVMSVFKKITTNGDMKEKVILKTN